MNQVTLVGNVRKDPEIFDNNGFEVATLTLATQEYNYSKKEKEEADWHTVRVIGRAVETCKQIMKGDEVLVVGRVRTERWTDKQTQQNRQRNIVKVGFNDPDLVRITIPRS